MLSDMKMRVFVGVLTWKSLFTNSIECQMLIPYRQFGSSVRPIYNVIRLKLFSISKCVLQSKKRLNVKTVYTTSKGVFIIKMYCVEFGDTSMGQGEAEFVNNFPFNYFFH